MSVNHVAGVGRVVLPTTSGRTADQAGTKSSTEADTAASNSASLIEIDETTQETSQENLKLKKLLNMSVNEIELSVRAANCLNNANITSVGQLAMKTEGEMLRYRNFGKKSLTEIKEKLAELGLSLGMKFDPALLEATPGGVSLLARSSMISDDDEEADSLDFSKLVDSHLPDADDEDE